MIKRLCFCSCHQSQRLARIRSAQSYGSSVGNGPAPLATSVWKISLHEEAWWRSSGDNGSLRLGCRTQQVAKRGRWCHPTGLGEPRLWRPDRTTQRNSTHQVLTYFRKFNFRQGILLALFWKVQKSICPKKLSKVVLSV